MTTLFGCIPQSPMANTSGRETMTAMGFRNHVNTIKGMWTDVRTFLRPFKGVNKRFFAGYIAMAEFCRNIKRVSPDFIAALVASHTVNR